MAAMASGDWIKIPDMLTFMRQFALLREHATRAACLQALCAILLGSQDVAVREAYARAKPG